MALAPPNCKIYQFQGLGNIRSRRAPASGKPGGQPTYANIAIEASLTIRLVFHLPIQDDHRSKNEKSNLRRTTGRGTVGEQDPQYDDQPWDAGKLPSGVIPARGRGHLPSIPSHAPKPPAGILPHFRMAHWSLVFGYDILKP